MLENMKELLLSDKVAELHIPLIFSSAPEAREKFAAAADKIKSRGASVVTLELFGGEWLDEPAGEFVKVLGGEFPVNRILPLDESSKPVLGGAHITALAGAQIDVLKTSEGDVGVKYFDGGSVDYFRTFGVCTDKFPQDDEAHTYENISRLERILNSAGYKYTDVTRTWFYNFDILSWYDSFNRARTRFYEERGVFKALLPASTGIGAPNKNAVRIESGAIVLKPRSSSSEIFEISSPLQCGAPEYGSSFARAVEVDAPKYKRIFVSGTASIEPGGATAFEGDIVRQVDLTMRVISEILKARGLTLKDTIRSVAYCLKPEYYETFLKWLGQKGLSDMPHVPSYSIVCRGDLLFEVELEAAVNI